MHTEKGHWNGNFQFLSDDPVEGFVGRGGSDSASPSNPLLMRPGVNCIEHRVSKMDTVAGIAIKYGVEVADIKRMNGLVTDLQMFAHKTLQIPLPGRHPPSPILSNGSASSGDQTTEQTPTRHPHVDILDSFQSLKLKTTPHRVSPAMSSLQGYYGLTSSNNKGAAEGMEMTIYRGSRGRHTEDNLHSKPSPFHLPPPGWKSRSLANGLHHENGESVEEAVVAEAGDSEAERSNEKSVRRRQKADIDPAARTSELPLKKEELSSGGFSGITGKGLALRPKTMSRASLATDADSGRPNPVPMAECFTSDMFSGVRKSSSTSNLQDSDNGSSIWPTSKWTLKPDLQALSTAAITRPIFDGLPKPISGRRKAAMD
ncbi:hypothetical protein MRB53_033754 [Persea americana]|uniref:Uncharacterized protein n=1 Tax=Persea americana TaxID=3435 RepID=A0ACC2KVF6_PERAE|nr:hypothetical protein MRB53_033754 [Persea americana]